MKEIPQPPNRGLSNRVPASTRTLIRNLRTQGRDIVTQENIPQANITVNEVEDKILADKVLAAISDRNNKNFTFAAEVVLAVKIQKETLIRTLTEALQKSGFNVVALNAGNLIALGEDVTASLRFYQRSKYCTVYGRYWCPDAGTKESFSNWLNQVFEKDLVKGTICGMRWAYNTKHGLSTTYIEELLTDVVYDQAYPTITRAHGSLQNFAEDYLESDESVLVLQGPPGTGKSRLIRYIMGKMVELKNIDNREDMNDYDFAATRSKSLVLYTSDTDSLKGDELFATFMTSDELMFIVEDADNMLRSREKGNDHLHRFLTISDGIIRNVGRKVVFTTNLPNMNDIDDALLRAGRCFAAISLGGLKKEEALAFVNVLTKGDDETLKEIDVAFNGRKTLTLAEVYKICKEV